jgi:hypothetical protein
MAAPVSPAFANQALHHRRSGTVPWDGKLREMVGGRISEWDVPRNNGRTIGVPRSPFCLYSDPKAVTLGR